MYNVKDIKNYILFLKFECGLHITLHPHGNESVITSSELIAFNIHDHPYCIYVKSFQGVWQHCIECQKKVRDKCNEGVFCGTCFAGVREFVYPIKHRDEILGFISVSGYKTDQFESYISRVAKNYYIPEKNLAKAYSFLRDKLPEREQIDTLVLPLCHMLELAYIKEEEGVSPENDVMDRVLRYVKRYHSQNITLDIVCDHFACSRSYVSHCFKKRTGKSFREYLTQMRLEDAKILLKYSNLSITEIALSVGFGDSTYFSNVFKLNIGVSPSLYRKK